MYSLRHDSHLCTLYLQSRFWSRMWTFVLSITHSDGLPKSFKWPLTFRYRSPDWIGDFSCLQFATQYWDRNNGESFHFNLTLCLSERKIHIKIKKLIWLPAFGNIIWCWHSHFINVLLTEKEKEKRKKKLYRFAWTKVKLSSSITGFYYHLLWQTQFQCRTWRRKLCD